MTPRRYIFWTVRCRIPQNFLPLVFPNLTLCVSHGNEREIDTSGLPYGQLLLGSRIVSVSVYRRVSFYFLLCHILQAPIRRVIESRDRSAPLVSMPCYLSALQIHNSAYIFEDGRMDSQDFDSEKIILRSYRTLVQFHGPKQQRSRNTEVKDLDPERAQRNARTLLDLIKVAGRFGSVTDSTSSGPSSTPVRNAMEDREAHMYLDLNAPAHMAATLNKEELDEMVNRVSSKIICKAITIIDSLFIPQLPEVVQACPDILRSRLFVSSKDAASPESLLSAIKQFQACYADFPDLTPCRPSLVVEPVVGIWLAFGTKLFAEGILSGRLRNDSGELDALVVEVKVGIRRQHHQWHRSSLTVRHAGRS